VKREGPALAAAMLYPTLLAYLYIVALPGAGADARAVQATWLGGKALECVLPLLWLRWLDGRWPRPTAPTGRGLVLGLGSGLAIAALMLLLYFGVLRHHHLFSSAPARVHQKVAEFGLDAPAAFLGFAALLSVVHSLLEEYYWRWFVFGRLQRLLPVGAAVLLASAAFMAFHLIDLAAFFPGRFFRLALPLGACVGIGGAGWCFLYRRSGSLYGPWLCHLVLDAALMTIGYDLAFVRPR
jgi:membrane protease YdiL (CAAX protease family)